MFFNRYNHSLLGGVALIAIAIAGAQPVFAQSAVDVPGPADIGQTEQAVPDIDFGTVTTPQINIPEIRVDDAPDGAENITFTLQEINIEGVTAYPVAQLQQIWADKIGTSIALTDIYAIARQITRQYRSDGYIVTQAIVPQQTIDNGIVTIQVVEGYISGVSVDGEEGSALSNHISRVAGQLMGVSPLTASALERWLLLVNDIPGLNARSVIGPSETVVGGADLTIIPSIDPYTFNVNFDNYGSRFLGPTQVSLAGQMNNLLGGGETLQAQFVTDPDDEERLYGFARLGLPLGYQGTVLSFDYSYSNTEPGFRLAQFDVEGESKTFGVDVRHPFIRTRTQNLYSTLRFDYRDLSSENNVDTFETRDQIAALRLGLDYSVFDNILRPAVNEVSFEISQGLDAFGASNKGDANMTRASGDPQFTKLETSLSRLQTLTPTLNLLTGIKGQWANNPLLSSEEFGVGGRSYGRGYDASELVGDDGFAATVELQWKPGYESGLMEDYELFTFYDFGKIWNQETDVNSLENRSLASTGLGLRADFSDVLSGEFIVAIPLTKDVDAYDDDSPKFLFSLSAQF